MFLCVLPGAGTHANTYMMEVCSPLNYVNLISLLANTSAWSVDGRQFRIWAELLPPTEAYPKGDNCQIPPDDPRTRFNESSFFNMSLVGWSPEEQRLRNMPYWDYGAPSLCSCRSIGTIACSISMMRDGTDIVYYAL